MLMLIKRKRPRNRKLSKEQREDQFEVLQKAQKNTGLAKLA